MKTTTHEQVYIMYKDKEILVEGEIEPFREATKIDPAEGGCFNVYNILNYAGIDILDKYDVSEQAEVSEKAWEELQGRE